MGLKGGKEIWKKWAERASGHRRWGWAGGGTQTLRWRKEGRSGKPWKPDSGIGAASVEVASDLPNRCRYLLVPSHLLSLGDRKNLIGFVRYLYSVLGRGERVFLNF